MKTSDKILIYAGFFVLILITALIVFSRITLHRQNPAVDQKEHSAGGEIITKEFQLDGFSGISVSGGWEVEITSGGSNQYQVRIDLPESDSDNLDVYKDGGLLIVKYKNFSFYTPGEHKIKVTMPKIARIDSSGDAKIFFTGFQSGNLDISSSGSCRLLDGTNTIGRLSIDSSGSSQINLNGSPVTNAYVHTSGSSTVELNMAGGDLTVNTSG